MGKDLSELDSQTQPLCEQLLNLAQAKGIKCVIIDTGRTPLEQEIKLRQGVSWTQNSKHLPQPPEMKSKAFDVCPKDYLQMKMWNPTGLLWKQLGEIGETLGLKWGGRWIHINNGLGDPGHFEC